MTAHDHEPEGTGSLWGRSEPPGAAEAVDALLSAGAVLSTGSLLHVLAPVGTLAGVQARVSPGRVWFRRGALAVPAGWEQGPSARFVALEVAEAVRRLVRSRASGSEVHHATGSASNWLPWVVPVRSGAFVYAAGAAELGGGPACRVAASAHASAEELRGIALWAAAGPALPGWVMAGDEALVTATRSAVAGFGPGLSGSEYAGAAAAGPECVDGPSGRNWRG